MRPGDFYAGAIVQAINSCRLLIVILSASSVASQHVLREVERASAKQRLVLSFRIDGAELPPDLEYFLSASQWLDARGGHEGALPALVEAVRSRDSKSTYRGPSDRAHAAAESSAASLPPHSGWTAGGGNRLVAAAMIMLTATLIYLAVDKIWLSKRSGGSVAIEKTSSAALSMTAPAMQPASDKSIAVLPFADMSERKDQEYFSDGLSEELIELLAKVPELQVPGRTSSFYFKGRQATMAEIAKALNVTHVLEGSVRKSGDMLRVTAQLVRADSGYQVWSDIYDRKVDDIFKIQDDIAGSVVKALKISLLTGSPTRNAPTSNAEAYRLYLQAESISFGGNSPAEGLKAINYLKSALQLDAEFAPAWAMLANISIGDFSAYGTRPFPEVHAEANEAAEHAVRLDPSLPASHVAMVRLLYQLDWSWDAAAAEIQKAIALEPGDVEAIRVAGYIAATQGRFADSIQLLQRATALDPIQPWNYIATAITAYRSGKLADAEAACQKAIAINPTGGKIHFLVGATLLAGGRPTDALEQMGRETESGYRQVGLALAFDALGRTKEADRELNAA